MASGALGLPFWNSVRLDQTPIADEAGNFQFNITQGDFRYGFSDQDPIPGYPISEAEQIVGVVVKPLGQPGNIVVRTVNLGTSAVRYKVRVSALYTQESDGDIVDANVTYAFDYRVDGGFWTNAVTEQIAGKTMSPYERAIRVQIPYATTSIEIRVQNLSQDSSSQGTINELGFASFTEIVDGTLSYDDTCLMAMTLDAEEFSNIPQRAYLLDGLMIQIPTNYNGRNHGYSGDWDGNFYIQWTNNPAWVLYNLITNERWGLGKLIDASRVDKWSFYDAATWNDGSVPDGKGGMQVRWTCNCVINTRQDALTVLNAIASTMLGALYYSGGVLYLVQDRMQINPSRIFGPMDVEAGMFDYMSADYRSQYNAVPVTWNDPDDNYNPAVELVQDGVLVAQQGYKEMSNQVAFGCTNRGQAQRYGRWLIYTSQYEKEVVTFRTGLENADVRPGEYIAISDPSRAGARLAGRLLHDDRPNFVTLDLTPDEMMSQPQAWHIYFTVGSDAEPDNSPRLYHHQVYSIGADGNPQTVQINGKPEPFPEGSLWLAHAGAVEPTPWRVSGIKDLGKGKYEITASEYHIEKFNYMDNGVTIPPPSFSLFPTGPLHTPTNLSFREFIYLDGAGRPQFGVTISWTASDDPRVSRYQLEMASSLGDYRKYMHVQGVSQDVLSMKGATWTAVIMAFDNIGRRSLPVSMTFTPIGLSARPQVPNALYLTPNGSMLTVTWIPTGEIDVMFYWLKWAPQLDGTATWERATTSIASVDRNTTQINTPSRSGTFMLKTIDSLGQESVDFIEAILLPQNLERIHITDIEEQPNWLGNKGTNWHIAGAELRLPPPDAPESVDPAFPGDRGLILNQTPTRVDQYKFQFEYDLGMVTSNVSMVGIIDAYGTFLGTVIAKWQPMSWATPMARGVTAVTMASWIPLAMAQPLAMGTSPNWDAFIGCEVSQDDGTTYAPMFPLKSTIVTGRKFRWTVYGYIYDLLTTLRLIRAAVIMEIPLRTIQGQDVPMDGTGAAVITYAVPFLATPTVQLTAWQSLAPGGNVVIVESDRNHFKVQHRNAAGTNAAGGQVDYLVQGYGGHS